MRPRCRTGPIYHLITMVMEYHLWQSEVSLSCVCCVFVHVRVRVCVIVPKFKLSGDKR